MKQTLLTAAILIAWAGARAATNEYATPTPAPILSTDMSGADLAFLTEAPPEVALVVELSALAKKHAVTPEVRDLAAGIFNQQTAAAESLKKLAATYQMPASQDPDPKGKRQLKAIAALKGVKFDKSYLDALSDAQDQLEAILEAGTTSQDKTIKAEADVEMAALKAQMDQVKKLGL